MCDLQRRRAHPAGRTVHEHRLALLQAPAQSQREVGGVVVEDQRRALREVQATQWKGEKVRRDGRLRKASQRAEGRHTVTLLKV